MLDICARYRLALAAENATAVAVDPRVRPAIVDGLAAGLDGIEPSWISVVETGTTTTRRLVATDVFGQPLAPVTVFVDFDVCMPGSAGALPPNLVDELLADETHRARSCGWRHLGSEPTCR